MPLKKATILKTYTSSNTVNLIRSGKPYFDCLLQLIDNAKETVHLQTYIFDDDETGLLVAEALMAAAKRKVKVYLLADGYASQGLSDDFILALRNAGVQFRYFEPVFKSRYFYFGRRMHHKLAVADAKYAMVGGVNISNRYNDMPQKPAWLDFALHVEGIASISLCRLCVKTWNGFGPGKPIDNCRNSETPHAHSNGDGSRVKISRNDWVRRKNEISKAYIDMLIQSKTSVTILCSYFLPGRAIRKQLAVAASRGVTIKVITSGTSDVVISKFAERWLYDWLLRKGVVLYEYQKNILHGKMAVCDDSWVTIGSYNINNISAYASVELNLEISDNTLAQTVTQTMEDIIIKDCALINTEFQKKHFNPFRQFIYWLSYQLIRMMIYLFTFYFKQKP